MFHLEISTALSTKMKFRRARFAHSLRVRRRKRLLHAALITIAIGESLSGHPSLPQIEAARAFTGLDAPLVVLVDLELCEVST